VGMFLHRLRKIRMRLSKEKLKHLMSKYGYKWLGKQRAKKRVTIYRFLKYTTDNSGRIEFKGLRYFKQVEKLQRNIKRFLVWRHIIYCIINHQWSQLEKEYIKKKGTSQLGNQEPSNIKEIESRVSTTVLPKIDQEDVHARIFEVAKNQIL